LCIYRFLSRRLPWQYAAAGMLFPALTAAGRYSYEARPYALLLAFGAIALVSWQGAAEGRHRVLALLSLALSPCAALSSPAFAVVLALPFLSGEIVRTMQRRRVDWPVWLAFGSTAPVLIMLWKLRDAGNPTGYHRLVGSSFQRLTMTYLQIITPAIIPLI